MARLHKDLRDKTQEDIDRYYNEEKDKFNRTAINILAPIEFPISASPLVLTNAWIILLIEAGLL